MRLNSIFLYSLLVGSFELLAQPGGGGDPGGGEPVPIQGIGLLLLAGAFFGIKKMMGLKKSK